MGSRKTYTAEFKRDAVNLLAERGGPRAGCTAGGSVGRTSAARIARMTAACVIAAMSLRRPPQPGQRNSSTANTRFNRSAHG